MKDAFTERAQQPIRETGSSALEFETNTSHVPKENARFNTPERILHHLTDLQKEVALEYMNLRVAVNRNGRSASLTGPYHERK